MVGKRRENIKKKRPGGALPGVGAKRLKAQDSGNRSSSCLKIWSIL